MLSPGSINSGRRDRSATRAAYAHLVASDDQGWRVNRQSEVTRSPDDHRADPARTYPARPGREVLLAHAPMIGLDSDG
jgi:hypothetical protein